MDDYHTKRCLYLVHALLTIMAAAHLSESPRGQRDLEKFAASLSQGQRRAVGINRRPGSGRYGAPDQSTFSRMMGRVDVEEVERVLLDWQEQIPRVGLSADQPTGLRALRRGLA